jgi:hypothetical protein
MLHPLLEFDPTPFALLEPSRGNNPRGLPAY